MLKWASTLVATLLVALLASAALSERRAEAAAIAAPLPQVEAPGARTAVSGGEVVALADGRREEIASLLNIEGPMHFGDFVWNEDGAPASGRVWIRVDLDAQLISVFRGGHEIGSAVVLYGAEGKPTPVGGFKVIQRAKDYHSRTYDAPMPYMLRLTADGVAIHASNVREGWATHGCIGVPTEFARQLFAIAQLGDPVVIVSSSAQPGPSRASDGP